MSEGQRTGGRPRGPRTALPLTSEKLTTSSRNILSSGGRWFPFCRLDHPCLIPNQELVLSVYSGVIFVLMILPDFSFLPETAVMAANR